MELRAPDRAIGRDTVAAIQSGTVLRYQALSVDCSGEVRAELAESSGVSPSDVHTIATGGLSRAPWVRGVRGIDAIDPELTLKGLAILHAEVGGSEPWASRGCREARPRAGRLAERLVGLGVTGSIAAYKAVELLRLLRAEGADVAVMLTPAAAQFVGPLSFAALSRHPVETDLLGLLPDGRIGHIVVGDTADAIVVAPATAHFLAAMAIGLAGDVVTATCLATRAPVIVAPAMDGDMWTHPATVPTSPACATTSAIRSSGGAWVTGIGSVRRWTARGAAADRGRRRGRRGRSTCPRPGHIRPPAAS